MQLLIGSTGLIGMTLKEKIKFDLEFNSKNIEDFLLIEDDIEDLYLSCLPATKWLINKNPYSDFQNMNDIIKKLKTKSYKRIFLFSTIDVYSNSPLKSDESYSPNVSDINYGTNRLIFEFLVSSLTFDNLIIIRLPGLFSKNIKKNILYDLINNNNVKNINYNSSYQWYDLNDLEEDIKKCIKTTEKISIFNLFPEPVETSEIIELFGLDKQSVSAEASRSEYDFTTNVHNSGYIYDKTTSLLKIKKFMNESGIK
jgi:hypothetical protein